ncbi:MAG: hypothetical protein HY052_09410 [Proteobacteria bacterium]|nr:hypothetical protein [Pseudomonadota bacterium]
MRCLALLAVILLSGCSLFSKETDDFSCPQIGFIRDADRISLPTADAVINGFNGACSLKKKQGVVVELTVPFAAKKSVTDAGLKNIDLPYFMAVLSPDETVLQRQTFSTQISFDQLNTGTAIEEHTIKIPLSSPVGAYKYKVVIGFVLTPEQLKHNKESK